MLWKQVWTSALCLAMVAAAASSARAAVFMQDDFDYADGQLTAADGSNAVGSGANVSGGLWTNHQGLAEFLQVDDGKLAVLISGQEDASRSSGQTMGPGDTWYYAARFTVVDNRPEGNTDTIGSNYFMHFKDEGTFNFLGRLYMQPPTVAGSNFTFGLSSYSVNAMGGQIVKWGEDLTFGDYTVVVSIKSRDANAETTDDVYSSLWVNPVNQASTSITDTMPHPDAFVDPDRTIMSRLAVRQANAGNTQPSFLVDKVAIGNSFADVLAAVSPAPANNADFNNDNVVDGADFLIWQAGNGLTGQTGKTNGNANADTVVDGLDFDAWKAKFGGAPAAAAAGTIPEPATLSLAALTLAALVAARRRA